jgi:hypothetical protein
MASIGAVEDPTDPGTLRPDFPPEPTIGTAYDLREYPQFCSNINLPIGTSNIDAFAIWSLFFSTSQLETIATNTNAAAQLAAVAECEKFPPGGRPFARFHHWFDTCPEELYTFLAILIYMGMHPECDIEQYWKLQDPLPNHRNVTAYMSCNRWQEIWSNFHISPLSERPPTQPQRKDTEFVKVSSYWALIN